MVILLHFGENNIASFSADVGCFIILLCLLWVME